MSHRFGKAFFAIIFAAMVSRQICLRLGIKPASRPRHTAVAQAAAGSTMTVTELLFYSSKSEKLLPLQDLIKIRPQLRYIKSEDLPSDSVVWSAFRNGIQLDGMILESYWLGKYEYAPIDVAVKWSETIERRNRLCASVLSSGVTTDRLFESLIRFGDGGALQRELDIAVVAVQAASFMSRSMQANLLSGNVAISKDDKTPVTIADFACQAVVIDALSRVFPNDKFIAEENSEHLRSNPEIRDSVLSAVSAATGDTWSIERLYAAIDKGAFDGKAARTWVLDPVDGTKGFMRKQNYCIALALLVEGVPKLSVLGCPNLSLNDVVQASPSNAAKKISKVGDLIEVNLESSSMVTFPISAGAVFFAVTDHGAFARSLSMSLGAAIEVTVSSVVDPSEIVLCEAAEAAHGNRSTSSLVAADLGLRGEFLRLDGQCKYCVVGSGGAAGNLRLPPSGYIEKVWDQAPGAHFITEAGGKVTDLQGRSLDFSNGRNLDASVTGILASNGVIHNKLLSSVSKVRT